MLLRSEKINCQRVKGDIISLSAFGTTIVALNKREDVINLFEKRSAIYSDRTIPAMVAEPSLWVPKDIRLTLMLTGGEGSIGQDLHL